jgi:transcriptional regulator with XRE-family HTH domain
MTSLGQELKRAREERGITLQDISNATHVGLRFLHAIENDTFDVLPGGVFNRAFVRKFAKQVGYDEEQAVRIYEEQLSAMGGEPQRIYYTGLEDLEAKPTAGNGLLISLVAVIVLGAGAYAAYQYFNISNSTSPETKASNNITNPVTTPVPTATPTPEPTAEPPGLRLQLAANDAQCWVDVTVDESEPDMALINPGDVREYIANQKLKFTLGYVPALKISLNGRQVKVDKIVTGAKSTVAKNVVVTKDNYLEFVY